MPGAATEEDEPLPDFSPAARSAHFRLNGQNNFAIINLGEGAADRLDRRGIQGGNR